MQRKENMDAITVISYITTIISRLILVFFGLVNLLGIIWFLGTTNATDFIRGAIFSISALYIGFSPTPLARNGYFQYVYCIICLFGIMASVWLFVKYSAENYRSFLDILEQIFIILCFVVMIVKNYSTHGGGRGRS